MKNKFYKFLYEQFNNIIDILSINNETSIYINKLKTKSYTQINSITDIKIDNIQYDLIIIYDKIVNYTNYTTLLLLHILKIDGIVCIYKTNIEYIDYIKSKNYIKDYIIHGDYYLIYKNHIDSKMILKKLKKKIKNTKIEKKTPFIIGLDNITINNFPYSLFNTIKYLRLNNNYLFIYIFGKLDLLDDQINYINEHNEYIKIIDIPSYYSECDIFAFTYLDNTVNIYNSNLINLDIFKTFNKPIICSKGIETIKMLGENYIGLYNCNSCNSIPKFDNNNIKTETQKHIFYNTYIKNIYDTPINDEIVEIAIILKNIHKPIDMEPIYNNTKPTERLWWWKSPNKTKITMTVALPSLRSKNIIWLALESLKNQIDITFHWELICFEEGGETREIIKTYANILPNCSKIIHRNICKNDMEYTNEQIELNNCISYYTLLEKWINIAYYSSKYSNIFVKHACDCYSSPKRLFIHNEHFKNKECHYSTQTKGYFYNILDYSTFLYDGSKIEPRHWYKYLIKKDKNINEYRPNTNIKVTSCHLNMALHTNAMKLIKLPQNPLKNGIDGFIFLELLLLKNIRSDLTKIVYNDSEICNNNWKYSLDTDGYNNISINRRNNYKTQKHPHLIPLNYNCKYIPKYIMDKLKLLSLIGNTIDERNTIDEGIL